MMKTKLLTFGLAVALCGVAGATEKPTENVVRDLTQERSFLEKGSLETKEETYMGRPFRTKITWQCDNPYHNRYDCKVLLERWQDAWKWNKQIVKIPARATNAKAKVAAMFRTLLVAQGATEITVTPNNNENYVALEQAGFTIVEQAGGTGPHKVKLYWSSEASSSGKIYEN